MPLRMSLSKMSYSLLPSENIELLQVLERLQIGEINAIEAYTNFLKTHHNTPSFIKTRIKEIRNDEYMHLRDLQRLKQKVKGILK